MDLGHMNVVCLFVCFEVDVFACWELIEAHISALIFHFCFVLFFESTQLARQLHQERTQMEVQ